MWFGAVLVRKLRDAFTSIQDTTIQPCAVTVVPIMSSYITRSGPDNGVIYDYFGTTGREFTLYCMASGDCSGQAMWNTSGEVEGAY